MELRIEDYHDYCMEFMVGSDLEPTETTPEEQLIDYVQCLMNDLCVVHNFKNLLPEVSMDHQIWEDIEFLSGELYRVTGWLTK